MGMDTLPGSDPMDNPPHSPLGGLDPANLLKQGAAEDTFMDGAATSFSPLPIEALAAIFPQFEILELIGKGGMGAVYKVRQRDLDRIVALKILPPAIGQSPEFSNRFTREAKALAKLNHPGIVTIHEFDQQDGLYFILMEFVDGVNLGQLMKTGRISPREALAIVPQICDALQFAHDQGIVHRDIKPENILLDRLGRVKVADFGIAKVVAAVCDPIRSGDTPVPTDATLHGKILGTPRYMAPEQIDHPSDVDHRADIYALGVVFYQMLTGELPGKHFEAPSKKVHIDVRLDEIVLRAMEKEPELRYQTAHEFRTVVDGVQAPANAMPPSLSHPPPKRGMLRRWWWVFLIMFPLGLLIGVAASSIWVYVIPKVYEAHSTIEVRPGDGITETSNFFATEFEVIKSRKSLAAVVEQLDLSKSWMISHDLAVQELKTIIQAQHIRGTDLISISVHHTDKQDAAAIAKAVTLNYQRSFPERVVIHEEPIEPTAPVSPNVRLTLVIGALLGLMLSPILAIILIAILQRLFPEPRSANSPLQAMKTRVDDLEAAPGEIPQAEQESNTRKPRVTSIMILALGSGVLSLICILIWFLLGHKDSFVPTIFVFCLFGIGLIVIASRPGPKRLAVSIAAVCTVLATLCFMIYVYRWDELSGNRSTYSSGESSDSPSVPPQAASWSLPDALKWLSLLDSGDYAKSWETASESFHRAVTKQQWVEKSEQVRKPLGDLISRKLAESQQMTTFPGFPEGAYFEATFDTSFEGLESANESLTFSQGKDGQWRVIGYLIKPVAGKNAEAPGPVEQAVIASAESWLTGIDTGNYAQSWKDAAMFFRSAIAEAGWNEALVKVRKPLGDMTSRKMLSATNAKSLPGAPDGEYLVIQFDTSFASKEKAVETVTYMRESDGTWKASGYFIR